MRILVGIVACVAGAILAAPASAQIDLDFDPNAIDDAAAALGISGDELDSLLNGELNDLYALADFGTFLRLSANAQSMANKGLGIDYASNVDGWVFGAAVSVAVADGGSSEAVVPISAGAQISLLLGYTVYDRLTLYVSGLYYELPTENLAGEFSNFGFHAQYKLIGAIGSARVAQWGGIDISTGIEYSRMKLGLSDTFDTSTDFAIDSVTTVILDTSSVGTLELTQQAITIPVEVTTNLTLFYFLSFYLGIAVDFQLGRASLNFDLDTSLNVSDSTAGVSESAGSVPITIEDTANADPAIFRVLGGIQINIWKIKLFGQLNFLTTDLTLSVAAGLRVVI